MTIHELKTWPEFFEKVVSGEKTFELRKDDRGFRAGDVLWLREWSPRSKEYTWRELSVTVTYLLGGFGLEKDWVVMGFTPPALLSPAPAARARYSGMAVRVSGDPVSGMKFENASVEMSAVTPALAATVTGNNSDVDGERLLKAATNALRILLASHDCLAPDGGAEIAEELSARFDIGLDEARQVIAALEKSDPINTNRTSPPAAAPVADKE